MPPPFAYISWDTRIDGIDMPPVFDIDNILEGVNMASL
jgi:hypothetical protein